MLQPSTSTANEIVRPSGETNGGDGFWTFGGVGSGNEIESAWADGY